jgi:hypothetical protein
MKVFFILLLIVVSGMLGIIGIMNIKKKSGATWLLFIMSGHFIHIYCLDCGF